MTKDKMKDLQKQIRAESHIKLNHINRFLAKKIDWVFEDSSLDDKIDLLYKYISGISEDNAETKPETQSLELNPEVKEAMECLKQEQLRVLPTSGFYNSGVRWHSCYNSLRDKTQELLNALDKQFKVNETSESVDVKEEEVNKIEAENGSFKHLDSAEKISQDIMKEKSIWKPVSELPEECGSAFIKFTTLSGIKVGYFYAGSETFYQNSNCDEEDEINKEYIKEACLISDFINDYEKLKERVKKLEGNA